MESRNTSLVSVIIPTYKRKETLKSAIDSIMQQTYKNLEIIVVDDNGADSEYRKSVEHIMQQYEGNNKITYVKNEKNMGGAAARNVGIQKAKGEYLAFLDDDDMYYPQKIEKQLEIFEKSKNANLALVYCYVEQLDENGRVNYVLKNQLRGNCLYEAMCIDCVAPTSLWLVKKSAVVDVGMFSVVPSKQDATLILKLLVKGYAVDYVPEVLCSYANFAIGEKITNYGTRSINGELLYREACRKTFGALTKQQQDNVEFEFLVRLYRIYSSNKMKDDTNKICKEMQKISLKKTINFFARTWLHQIKHGKSR